MLQARGVAFILQVDTKQIEWKQREVKAQILGGTLVPNSHQIQ